MDKEIIYFLVSESRIVGYSSEPDSEEMMQCAREAILFGDRSLKIVQIQVVLGLTESIYINESTVEVRHEENIEMSPEMLEAFDEGRLKAQQAVWDSMPAGIYRIQKEDDAAVSIEYCPDIGESDWSNVEMKGWGYQSRQ